MKQQLLTLDLGRSSPGFAGTLQEKPCAGDCGTKIRRKRGERAAVFNRRKYCPTCANNYRHPEGWSADHSKAQKFKLDRCEGCGAEGKLHGHHVDGNPANNVRENIQTLCVYCHNFVHRTAKRLGWSEPGRMPAFSRVTG